MRHIDCPAVYIYSAPDDSACVALSIANNELGPISGAVLAANIGWRLSSIVTALKGGAFLTSLEYVQPSNRDPQAPQQHAQLSFALTASPRTHSISFNHLDKKAKRAIAKAFRGRSSQLVL